MGERVIFNGSPDFFFMKNTKHGAFIGLGMDGNGMI
jgi:hypothetical protein